MKRRIVSLFLALMLLSTFVFSVHALEIALIEDGNSVYDEANLLSSSEEEEIAEVLDDLGEKYDTHLVIVTVSELDSDPDYFAENLYDTMDFGYGSHRDGVLLVVCMESREYSILCNGSAANAIDPDTRDEIGDTVASYLSDGDYAEAFLTFADRCEYYLDGYENGFPFPFGKRLLTALVVGIVVGLIVVAILAAQLKSVHKKNQARDYVKAGSMRLTLSNDIFLYRNVQRTKKESSSSSGSGSRSRSGGSRHVGGGKF